MLDVVYHLVSGTLLFLLIQSDCRLYQLKQDILHPFLFPLNTVPSNFLFLIAFTILSGLLPFTKNTSIPIIEIFVASSTFLVMPPVTSILFFEIVGFSPFNSRINFFDFRSEYKPSSFSAKTHNLGFRIFERCVIILSPDKMYVFLWPYQSASPKVIGISPTSAIFLFLLFYL